MNAKLERALELEIEAYILEEKIRERTAKVAKQVKGFRALAKKNGWKLSPAIEKKMAARGMKFRPTKTLTVKQGVEYMAALYRDVMRLTRKLN